jgi:hypothetical protein
VDFYKQKIPILRGSLNEGFLRGAPDREPVGGAVPRDFDVQPVEMRDAPGAMQLYDPSEYDALYDQGEEREDSLEHVLLRGIESGLISFLDQNGFPDCWVHSVFNGKMVSMLMQGLPVVRLNAVTAATMMGRTDGGWCGLGMQFLRDRGAPVVGPNAPYQSRQYNRAAVEAEMGQHKALELWYDLGQPVHGQDMTNRQFETCLFNNHPTPSDYNRHGHSMLSVRRVRIERDYWGTLTWNSWKGFGYKGLCVLAGYYPDGSCALRV